MGDTWLQRAKRQRFISILTRFPSFAVDEDAENEVMKKFEQRVKWEKFVLKMKGGYDVLRYNVYDRFQWTEADLVSEGCDVLVSPSKQGTTGDQKNFCALHLTGNRAEFREFVFRTVKKLSSALQIYTKEYPFQTLKEVVQNDKLPRMHELYHFYTSIDYIQDYLSSNPLNESREEYFEPALDCPACKLSVLFSDTGCVGALCHLDEIKPQYELLPIIDAILEQTQQYATCFTRQLFTEGYSFMIDLETRIDQSRNAKTKKTNESILSSSSTTVAGLSSTAPPQTPAPTSKYRVNLPSSPSSSNLEGTPTPSTSGAELQDSQCRHLPAD